MSDDNSPEALSEHDDMFGEPEQQNGSENGDQDQLDDDEPAGDDLFGDEDDGEDFADDAAPT